MRYTLSFAFAGLAATPAFAGGIDLTITIPQLKVAEYHKPYVAAWIEQTGAPAVTNLAVWYNPTMKNNEGTKWLRDIRTWWRKAGRSLKVPTDGVTGATRAPGSHKISFTEGSGALGKLAPGNYTLFVEAARETGGREIVRLPFAWPAQGAPQTARATGTSELGAVSAVIRP